MGKQVGKMSKKELTEDEMLKIPPNQIFTCWHCLMMIVIVLVGIIVTALIVKAAELRDLNDEKDATIDSLAADAEELKQKLYKSISDSKQQQEVKENIIEKLNSKIQTLNGNVV